MHNRSNSSRSDFHLDKHRTSSKRVSDPTSIRSPQVGRNRRWQLNLFDPDGSRAELMEPFPIK
jgi:hypothetical protein